MYPGAAWPRRAGIGGARARARMLRLELGGCLRDDEGLGLDRHRRCRRRCDRGRLQVRHGVGGQRRRRTRVRGGSPEWLEAQTERHRRQSVSVLLLLLALVLLSISRHERVLPVRGRRAHPARRHADAPCAADRDAHAALPAAPESMRTGLLLLAVLVLSLIVAALSSLAAQAFMHPARQKCQSDRAVISAMLIMISEAVHVLVPARALADAARERAQPPFRLAFNLDEF